MSLTPPRNAPPQSNFQSIFNNSLHKYKKQTREDLFLHPLAAKLQSCDSPHAVLSLLKEQATDERLTSWLSPVVNAIYALSSSLGEDACLVLSPAKLVFVAIGVLLSAAQAIESGQDTLIDVFKRMEHFFQRIETSVEISATNSMKEMNGKIIVAVLSILGTVTEGIKQGRARRYFRKSIEKCFKKLVGRDEIEDGLQRLDRTVASVARMANAEVPNNRATSQTANHVRDLNGLSTSAAVSNGASDALLRGQLLEEVQTWLSPPNPTTNHDAAREARLEGTAKWFLQGKNFQTWKSAGSLLWIHGKPGSGKSVLCSAIIEDIEDMCNSGSASMAYFVFDFRDHQKQSRTDMIHSLITQFSTRCDRYCDVLSRLYSVHNRGSQMPSGGDLTQCLKDMLSLCKDPVYIIMDAIDECPNIPGVPSPREEVLELVKELVEARLPNLRLCATSRPEISIRAVLEPLPSLRVSLHDEIGQKRDIIDYIKITVRTDARIGRWREEDKSLVIDTLSERANGMFRWVSCQLDILRRCFPPSVRRVLDELPESLDETYERILMEISVTNGKQARRLLQCLTAAFRPLRVEELAEVLAIDFDAEGEIPKLNLNWRWEDQEQAVLSACSSLIAVVNVEGSKIVQFSHPSVKEFLTSNRLATSSERASSYHIQLEPAHTILAQACLSVLYRLDDRVDKSTIEGLPLAEYAARYWVDHARFKNVTPHVQNGMEILFDPEEPHFANWVGIYDIDDFLGSPKANATRSRGGPLYYSSLCGFNTLVEHLIDNPRVDVKAQGGRYVTPLHASLYKGNIATALLLIRHGLDVNALDDEGSTPLRIALHCGSYEVVQALLENGADVGSRDDERWTPLHIASHSGYIDVVRLLLERDAEVDARDVKGRTPLHMASHNGDRNIVKLLLEHGADAKALDNETSTPLHLVSVKGNLEVVDLLVQHGAAVDSRDNKDSTPLHLALANGNRKVVEYLIRHSANANAQDNKKLTPLHIASLNGDSDIVNLLVKRDADVNALDNKRWTPLHLASVKGTFEVVNLLLRYGAKVDAEDNKHSTPLHEASRRGPSDIVTLLLKYGAEPNARNDIGWTPLHVASREGAVDVVRCLLGRGADVNAGDGDRRTPLHIAVNNKNTKIVQLLIENGADPCAQDSRQQIPFQLQPVANRGRRANPRS